MAQVIELRDGGLVTPLTVFDALDVVEEYLGTDMRQYLEEYFPEEYSPPDHEEVREHYALVLQTIDDAVQGILGARRITRPFLEERIARIHDIIRRENA